MVMPKDSFQTIIQDDLVKTWRTFIDNLESSLDVLEKGVDEAAEMSDICTSEWCEATEHVMDELSNSLFSISEPRWSSDEDSRKIRALKQKVHDIYAKYKGVTARKQ